MKKYPPLLAFALLALTASLHAANEIGFVEKFALAADRDKALTELAPGTEEFYFFHALHYQSTKNADKLAKTMQAWRNHYRNSSMRDIIENREALLAYDADPQRTLNWLRDKLNLHFNHQQEVRDKKPNLPTTLDQGRISREVFLNMALQHDNLSGLSVLELERLVRDKTQLSVAQIRTVLTRLTQPDVPGLVEMIAEDLKRKDAPGFGAFPIHTMLLPEQLDKLVKLVPRLANEPAYVHARIAKLLPGADEDADFDPVVREAWLERLWAYAKTLPPSFNSLKASILYRRLEHDRQQGVYDAGRFLEYLKLPRQLQYIALRVREEMKNTPANWCDLNATFAEARLTFPPIYNDEPLVRDYFLNLLVNDSGSAALRRPDDKKSAEAADPLSAIAPYTDYVNADRLMQWFAEAMITSGRDRPERWASLITPAALQYLKDRVDIDFALQNKPFVNVGDDVSLDLHVKNVPQLIVRIYEINTLGFFLQNQRQLNTDLNLDGLVANTEATHAYSETPYQRVRRSFNFPELKGKRGSWVIEFIGGGRSSRALIRTGQWNLVQRTGAAGDQLTVLDEKHAHVKDAVVWLDGRKFIPDSKTGSIIVPFTAKPGRRPVILADKDGTFATLTEFEHHAENYQLDAQFYLNREQLIAGKEATLAVRTALLAGSALQPLALLKDTKLSVTTTTLDGVSTTKEVKPLKLESGSLLTHVISIPDRLQSISATISASVEQMSKGQEKVIVTRSRSWSINGIDHTEQTRAGHFSKMGDGHIFELLGKNGEPVPDQQVVFQIWRIGHGQTVHVALRTDEKGRVQLGKLEGINHVVAEASGITHSHAYPARDQLLRSNLIHAGTEDVIEIPVADAFKAANYALLELREENPVADRSEHINPPEEGKGAHHFTIAGLTPGDYRLVLRDSDDTVVKIRITKGKAGYGWVFGGRRNLEIRGLHPLNITSTAVEGNDFVIKLANGNPYTQVSVTASRFHASLPVFGSLSGFLRFSPSMLEPAQMPNLYSAGREIGDEYRYILDRRFAKIFPGNMLTRPGLLLNPWELRTTGQTELLSKGGQAAGATRGGRAGAGGLGAPVVSESADKDARLAVAAGANLDFLANAAPVLLNLVPDKNGVVRVPLKLLGDRQFIEVYAEDLSNAVQRHFTLPEQGTKFTDLRLARALDPAKPFSEKKQATVLQTGAALTLADIRTSEMETYDTLGGVFSLYTTLSGSPELAKFAWILEWPKLKDEEKRAKYSEFACHELSFFLSRKDPQFFEKIIKPYLANKKDKTFLDEYLLGLDLHRHLEPWRFARLNAAERALLGRRLPEETKNAARHLRERWELIPPNYAEEDRLFETALRGRALDLTSPEGSVSSVSPDGKNTYAGFTTAGGMFRAEKGKLMHADTPAPAMTAPGSRVGASAFALSNAPVAEKAAEDEFFSRQEESKKQLGKDRLERGRESKFKEVEGLKRDADDMDMLGDLIIDAELVDAKRAQVRAYYRQLGPVKEWAENNYWHLPLAQQGAELIAVNAFWRDLAEWDGKGAFVSPHLAEAHHSFAEIMLALGVLDLPFEAPKHGSKVTDGRMTITAGSAVVVYHKEILPAAAAPPGQHQELLVSQAFFRHGDRYRMKGNLKFDKYITTEFLSGAVYGANIVVTNPSSAPADLDLLLQIPQGALPVMKSRVTSSQHIMLEPYTTRTFEYYFYFPMPGAGGLKFAHYPVNTSVRGTAVAAAAAFSFNVVNKLTEVDKASWDYISQYGTDAEALLFLEQNNIERLNLERIAWRCRKDAGFFRKLITLLEQRHRYDATIYSYGVMHNDPAPMREYLRHRNDFIQRCGAWFESRLISIDPIERRTYEHLEYSPLVNQRAHRVGNERRIATPEQRTQYLSLMNILAHKPSFDAVDNMSVTYHLFLQDRVEEALARFRQVNASELPIKIQHDYLKCYAAFYEGNLAEARGIASQRSSEPVTRWRDLFIEVSSQIDEIEGKSAKEKEKPDREKAQAALAATEPTFEFKIEKQNLNLTWKNLKEVTVNYYLMDPEFAFSSSPFAGQGAGRFSIIKPNKSARLELPAESDSIEAPLPAEYARANVLVEVLGAGQRKAKAHLANTLKLTVSENYGRLEVRDRNSDRALPKAYVKVYARLQGGTVRFFKDGYTDLRGRFDYASLNSPANPQNPVPMRGAEMPANGLDYQMLKPGELNSVEKISILVMSESNGAEVKEVAPPSE